MTALESIIAWAEGDLPEWLSDAVRRLLLQDSLTEDDRHDLLLMLKSLHDLLPDGTTPPIPQPLKKGMVSGVPTSKVKVVLKAVKALSSINKIPDGSVLPFGHQGLTAIYGENGSGKSGYARILKRACRARDTEERILPNLYSSKAPTKARAALKLSVNSGPDEEIEWEDGKSSRDVLTNITVFDSKCARVIIDEKNEANYLPYGAHVFEELVNLLKWIKVQIEAEKPRPTPLQFSEIGEETQIGVFIDSLTHKTAEKEVEERARWTDTDSKKLNTLTKHLAELEANDPVKQAAKLNSFKERVLNLVKYANQRATVLSDESLGKLEKQVVALAEAEKAVALASKATLQDEPLAGAGESAWQILYNAAKDFSIKDAYPGEEFPVVRKGSRCVLCMQPLDEESKKRLLRFKEFMEQSAKKKHEHAKRDLNTTIGDIESLKDPASTKLHENTIDEVKQRNEATASAVESFLSSANSRIEYFRHLATDKEIGDLSLLPNSPKNALKELISDVEQEIASFQKAIDPAERDKLKKEKAELLARKCFVENKTKILS